MSRHRLERTRPRYGRIAAAGSSVAVTAIAVLGAAGAVPVSSGTNDDDRPSAAESSDSTGDRHLPSPRTGERRALLAADAEQAGAGEKTDNRAVTRPADQADTALPPGSGSGRRVVFSEAAQRVWLVEDGNEVARTYLVSGSRYDNLDPGTYSVFSRSEHAWGIDDSGSMRWFVRFAEGPNAAIGFHSIPLLNGSPVQTIAQLGLPLSHGCIRQKTADALALWEFAPVGTTVVVV